jgi:hypothetical protein
MLALHAGISPEHASTIIDPQHRLRKKHEKYKILSQKHIFFHNSATKIIDLHVFHTFEALPKA